MSDVHWYPGHMTKAVRQMKEDIRLIDVVVELVDARIPLASRNPDIDDLARGKARVLLLNKSDLADPAANDEFRKYFEKKGFLTAEINARNGKGVRGVKDILQDACKEKQERDRKRGILNRPVRAMVVGIPNVGKSTFINSFAGKAMTKTGNKPGVTKGKQWIKVGKQIELLDTPGILWPKFENREVAESIAFIGSIRDEVLNRDDLAVSLMKRLDTLYPGALAASYELEDEEVNSFEGITYEIRFLTALAKRRGLLKKGGELDLEKAAFTVLEEYRNGKTGRFTLERPTAD